MRGKDGILIEFLGHGRFWLLTDEHTLTPTVEGPLAPLDQCSADGELLDFLGTSYAHLFPRGDIKRFSTVIGNRSDLIEVNNELCD